jgi:hypothetical protein
MKNLRFVWVVAMAFGLTLLYAQSPIDALRAAEARFLALDSYAATMGVVMGEHRDVGKVYYQGKKFQLDFPEDQSICDGVQTMNYSKEFAAINFSEPLTGPDLSVGGIYGLHRFPFKFEWVDTSSYMMRMRLTAPNQDLSPSLVLIGIGKKSGFVEEFSFSVREDLKIEMVVIEFQLNPVLDPKLFMIDMDFVRRVENGEVAPIEHEH